MPDKMSEPTVQFTPEFKRNLRTLAKKYRHIRDDVAPIKEVSNYMGNAETESATRNNRNICLHFFQETHNADIIDPINFRKCIDQNIALFPELFPPEISKGYQMKDIYYPKKQSVPIRRIEIAGIAYTLRPSFLLPYIPTTQNTNNSTRYCVLNA